MRLLSLLTATLLALLAATGTAHALDGRIADDPCGGPQTHLHPSQWRSQALQCNAVFEIPPHRTWADPISYEDGRCPGSSYMVNEGAWDYWTLRGEWVTWNGWHREAPHLGSDDEHESRRTYFVAPFYHNWSSWDWPTRTVEHCYGAEKLLPKLAAFRVAEPAGDAPGEGADLGSGDDAYQGTGRADAIQGGEGDDALLGGRGGDQLLGGRGADRLSGGDGSDELFDRFGRDRLDGGDGNDRLSTKDGNRDTVSCGAGEDIAIGDPRDTFRDCEHVFTTPENTPDEPPTID
ncbi:MAG TPA: calcium-binding protein [Capillimicrobium sp.]|jgi:hypothetical protein